jgi:cytochrome c oxidase assembly protein subunit 15
MVAQEKENQAREQYKSQIGFWLLGCCVMIYMMVVIGGVTRLTHSGLSMVEWKPILGTIPPLSEAQWKVAFDKYKAYPEYKVRRGMKLPEFKRIFLVEYFHRLFGRMIGLVFFFPFVFFWIRKRIQRRYLPHMIGLFVLGGCQGLLGWYMVKSGLINVPRVSPYRLTAHLMLAFFLYAYTLWLTLDLFGVFARRDALPEGASAPAWGALYRWSKWSLVVVTVMVASGGFVAGTRAGFAFNTFPLMNGSLFPSGLLNHTPWYLSFFENNLTVQFDHRMIAYLLCVLIPFVWWKGMKSSPSSRLKLILHLMLGALVLQVTLGITTLLWVVPVPLAAAHQAGALLLFTCLVALVHYLKQMSTPAS